MAVSVTFVGSGDAFGIAVIRNMSICGLEIITDQVVQKPF